MSLHWYRKQWKSDLQSNKASQNTRTQLLTYAPTEDWTQTLQFTRLTLYHWAIETTSLKSKCHYVNIRNKASQTRNETKPQIQLLIYAPNTIVDICPHWGLKSRPSVYKTGALPLSYRGKKFKVKLHYVDIRNQASQTRNLPQALITETKPQQRIQEHSCWHMPPLRIELKTFSLQDWRSTTEL